ncbi:MAG: (Fe-S)-binding protein [Desulfoferrobacter sp.]
MKLNVMEVLRELPKTNCKECNEPTCMAFATKLLKNERKLEECKPILTEEFAESRKKLEIILQAA